MNKIEIDITHKIVHIECANPECGKDFVKSFDELSVSGIVICPKCCHKHFLMKISKVV
jgi:DNA-directed RNA polymerase subunit RPC12/RpoP